MNNIILKFLFLLAFLPAFSYGQDVLEGFENACPDQFKFLNNCIDAWIPTSYLQELAIPFQYLHSLVFPGRSNQFVKMVPSPNHLLRDALPPQRDAMQEQQ